MMVVSHISKVISIHEYVLRSGADEKEFEQVLREVQASDLLQLPGLEKYYFVKGIRGSHCGNYAAVWIYESQEAWEKLWGSIDQPCRACDYPENWKIWEEGMLAPFLDRDPDKITYTAYESL